MSPVLVVSQAMTANQRGLNIFANWQYEFAPYAAMVKLLIRATTAGVLMALYSGDFGVGMLLPILGRDDTERAEHRSPDLGRCSEGPAQDQV